MSKPFIHAKSSAKRYGGKMEDYLDIHDLMDSSKTALADNRHRALTHNIWFVKTILPKVFGQTRTNSDGRTYSVLQIGEDHIAEDFGMKFIPTAQDFLEEMPMKGWMMNGKVGYPPSQRAIKSRKLQDND